MDYSPLNLLYKAMQRKPHTTHLVGVAPLENTIFNSQNQLNNRHPEFQLTHCSTVTQSYDLTLRLITLLKHHQVTAGDRVVICAPNSVWHLLIHLACSGLHAISVPLDQHYQPSELDVVLNDCTPTLIFAGPLQCTRIKESTYRAATVINLSELPLLAEQQQPALGKQETAPLYPAPFPPADADVIGALIYTSGTASHPKGVTLTHANLWWGCRNFRETFEYSSDCVEAVVAPLSHIGGFNGTTLDLAYSGGTVVVIESFHPATVLAVIEHYRVQMMFGVPTIYQRLLLDPSFTTRDLTSFTRPLIGGSALPAPVAKQMHEVGWTPYNVWGMTEQSASGTCLTPHLAALAPTGVGVPFPFTRVRIVSITDLENGVLKDEVPGNIGMLVCAGPSVTRGYWQDSELNEQSFLAGWLVTGDLGFVDEQGVIQFAARAADTINTGGEKVLPEPVAAVLRKIPGVRDAAVVGVADAQWGQVVAAVLLADTNIPEGGVLTSCSETDLLKLIRDYAGQYLARYKLPRRVKLVEAFPVSSNGKISKKGLQELFSADS